jgi:hypothetical protein
MLYNGLKSEPIRVPENSNKIFTMLIAKFRYPDQPKRHEEMMDEILRRPSFRMGRLNDTNYKRMIAI